MFVATLIWRYRFGFSHDPHHTFFLRLNYFLYRFILLLLYYVARYGTIQRAKKMGILCEKFDKTFISHFSVKCSQTIALICGYAIFLCRMQTSSNLVFFFLLFLLRSESFRCAGFTSFFFLIKWWILVDFELSFYIVIICSLFSFNKNWCELFSFSFVQMLLLLLRIRGEIIFGGWTEDFWWL